MTNEQVVVKSEYSLVGLLWGILVHPGKTFVHLKEHHQKAWWLPAFLILALILTPVVIGQRIVRQMPKEMTMMNFEGEEMDVEDMIYADADFASVEMVGGGGPSSSMPPMNFEWLILAGTLIATPMTWLIWGGMLYLVSVFLGRSSHFSQMFHLVVWAWVPYAIRGLVQTIVLLVTKQPVVNAGLSSLVLEPSSTVMVMPSVTQLALASVLSRVDVYLVWNLALLTLGLMVFTNLPRRKALTATLIVWAIFALLGALPALVGGMFGTMGGGF